MKIGDEVYVRGYVDEIRRDCVIIRNNGGYFVTIQSEVIEVPFKMVERPIIKHPRKGMMQEKE